MILLLLLLASYNPILSLVPHVRSRMKYMRGGSQSNVKTGLQATSSSEPKEQYTEAKETKLEFNESTAAGPPSTAPAATTAAPLPAYLPSLTLFLTYMCTMGSKCALPLAIPHRYPPPLPSPAFLSNLGIGPDNILSVTLLCSTLAVSVTKAMSGSVIDKLGGGEKLSRTNRRGWNALILRNRLRLHKKLQTKFQRQNHCHAILTRYGRSSCDSLRSSQR